MAQKRHSHSITAIARMFKYRETEHKNMYGFIELKNPYYMQDYADDADTDKHDYESKYFIRKPTPAERREIVINTIIEGNGKPFKISRLAELLAVSDRTIQLLLRSLENEGVISSTPRFDKTGMQRSSSYKYTGEPCKFYGIGLTLKKLYNPKESYGFRFWAWKNRAFSHNGDWHSLYCQTRMKFSIRKARRKYLEENNLPLIVPENLKYIVLRYEYWRGENRILDSDDLLLTNEGAIKIKIAERGYKVVNIYCYKLLLLFLGNADNPKIKVYDLKRQEKLATFTWFSENRIDITKALDSEHTELFFVLGDFTTK